MSQLFGMNDNTIINLANVFYIELLDNRIIVQSCGKNSMLYNFDDAETAQKIFNLLSEKLFAC